MLNPAQNDSLNRNRRTPLPPGIDAMENYLRNVWKVVHEKDPTNNWQNKPHPTLHHELLASAGKLLYFWLNNKKISDLKILEIMAGNCRASQIIQKEITGKYKSWKMTDIGDYSTKSEQLDAVCAVEKYGKVYNTLLLICPPPGSAEHLGQQSSYGDYYACKKFIEMENGEQRYIFFIGELGNSDGSQGMYLYMMKHPSLILEFRHPFLITTDHLEGPVEKEVFVFSIWK